MSYAPINVSGYDGTIHNLTVNGTLTAVGSATPGSLNLTGTLGVTGATTLSTVSTSGNATIGGTLGVTGTTTVSNLIDSGVTANTVMLANASKQLASASLSGLTISGTTLSTIVGGYLFMQSTNNQIITPNTSTTIQFPTINSNTFGSNLTISGTGNTIFTNSSGSPITFLISALIPVYVNSTNATTMTEGGSWVQDNNSIRYGALNLYCPGGFYYSTGVGSVTYAYFPTSTIIVLPNGGSFAVNIWLTQSSGNITISQNVAGLISTLVVKQLL